MINTGVILFTSLSSEKVDYLQHETNNGIIDIGRKICVDRQMSIIEATNVHVGRSDATISTETDTADKEVSNFTRIVRLSKTKGKGKNSKSLSKHDTRKSLSLRSLNETTQFSSPKRIQVVRKYTHKQNKKHFKFGNTKSFDCVSLSGRVCGGYSLNHSEAVSDLTKEHRYEPCSNNESFKELILNVASIDYNGFELHDPTDLMFIHFDTHVPTEMDGNARLVYYPLRLNINIIRIKH